MSDTTTSTTIPEHQIKLPFQSYKVRVLKCEKKISKKGQPMLVQEVEICEASPFTQDGVSVNPNGISMTSWTSLQIKTIDMINVNRNSLGLRAVKTLEIGDINPDEYVGQVGGVVAMSEESELKNDVTGETVLNPFTGKPVKVFNKRVQQWLARE